MVEAYRNIPAPEAGALAKDIFGSEKKPHWITFTSSSTVKNFLDVAGRNALDGVRIASIGPVTSETARSLGLTVDTEAKQFTIDGLIQAILDAEK